MDKKIFTVAILGAGSRGADAYGTLINTRKDEFDIVAICDQRQERLDRFGKEFGVEKDMLFLDEKVFFEKKRADLLVIATQDADHYRHAMAAFKLGYHILLEKPLTDNIRECKNLLKAQKKYNVKALVCHVLRYAPAFYKLHELVNSGVIGRLVGINANEGPNYWHQAHSYVRGNWRRREDSTPMILAKCCHDLDLLQWYAGSKCKSVSSVGNLSFFTKENAPENTSERCVDCRLVNECPYSAKRVYIDRWKDVGSPVNTWPFNVVTSAPVDEEKLKEAIKVGPYGKCAFRCDNDVVDNQIVMMEFENGVKAELTMTAFTSGRRYLLFGTYGNILLDGGKITVTIFGDPKNSFVLDVKDLEEGGHAHGGGDGKLINSLYDTLLGKADSHTSLEHSIESHLMGILAEKSREKGGKLYKVH